MARGPRLQTHRLTLRRWRRSDLEPFAALNADPVVMEHYPSTLDVDESKRFIGLIEETFDKHGYGLWALELAASGDFVGYCGLWPVRHDLHFTPAVEIGWRMAKEHWGNGYATEAARAAVRYGFEEVGLDEIVSFTSPANTRSIRVMQRIGMVTDPSDDFDHPSIGEESPLRRHVLYRMSAAQWVSQH